MIEELTKDPFISCKDAAEFLHMHKGSLQRICRQKRIDFHRISRKYFFTIQQLKAFAKVNATI